MSTYKWQRARQWQRGVTTFLLLNGDGDNLLSEDAPCCSWLTALVALYCILILLLTTDWQILRTQLRTDSLQHQSTAQYPLPFNNLLFSSQDKITTNLPQSLTNCVMLDQLIDVAMSTVIIPDVCMYVIFIRCDGCTSNNKHKKQSQNGIQYKAAKPKTISFHKAI